jgi:hypothetical protein
MSHAGAPRPNWVFELTSPMGGASGEAFANTLASSGMPPAAVLARESIQILALALALAFTGPAFAGATAAKTEADCTKAGGTWDAATNTCAEKKP